MQRFCFIKVVINCLSVIDTDVRLNERKCKGILNCRGTLHGAEPDDS